MYNYNVKTKELTNIFNRLRYVVDPTNKLKLSNITITGNCTVISLFNSGYFVGYPIELIDNIDFNFNTVGDKLTGSMTVTDIQGHRTDKVSFSIHETVLYIRSRPFKKPDSIHPFF